MNSNKVAASNPQIKTKGTEYLTGMVAKRMIKAAVGQMMLAQRNVKDLPQIAAETVKEEKEDPLLQSIAFKDMIQVLHLIGK